METLYSRIEIDKVLYEQLTDIAKAKDLDITEYFEE